MDMVRVSGLLAVGGLIAFGGIAKADTIDAYLYATYGGTTYELGSWAGASGSGTLNVSQNVSFGGASGTVNFQSFGPNGGAKLPLLNLSSTEDVNMTNIPAGTTLALYVVDSGVNSPTTNYSSGFTILQIPNGSSSATETTYVKSGATPVLFGSTPPALGTPLGSFTGAAPSGATEGGTGPSGLVNLVEEFSGYCTSGCSGQFSGQESISATPLPATLALFAGGLGLLGLGSRRRSKRLKGTSATA